MQMGDGVENVPLLKTLIKHSFKNVLQPIANVSSKESEG